MAPPRATAEAALAGVEEDVERRRHVKDPFREPFVALVAAPFDAFLARASGEPEVNAALQQDITARSQQVHLRLEILRRQVQSLMLESSAVLDSTSTAAKKESLQKITKAPVEKEETGDESVDEIESLLEKVALYESGELSCADLQMSWRRACTCQEHKVTGADAKLESLRAEVEEAYEIVRERELQYYGPELPTSSSGENCHVNELDRGMIQFLEECKRSIKPFFLEDFVINREEAFEVEDARENLNKISNPDSPVQAQPQLLATSPILDNVKMVDGLTELPESQPDHSSDAMEARAVGFDVSATRLRREAMHKQAIKVKAELFRSRRLPISAISSRRSESTKKSQVSVSSSQLDSVNRTALTSSRTKPLNLLSDPRTWHNFSLSIVDPTINLLDLRQRVSVQWDAAIEAQPGIEIAEQSPSGLDDSPYSVSSPDSRLTNRPTPMTETESTPSKRHSDAPVAPHSKKQRVDSDPKPTKALSLRALMQRVETKLRRIAETSCVTYLSTLLRSTLAAASPQRAFVALVFSASLANVAPDQVSSRSDTHAPKLRVKLQPTSGGHDVKLTCRQE